MRLVLDPVLDCPEFWESHYRITELEQGSDKAAMHLNSGDPVRSMDRSRALNLWKEMLTGQCRLGLDCCAVNRERVCRVYPNCTPDIFRVPAEELTATGLGP